MLRTGATRLWPTYARVLAEKGYRMLHISRASHRRALLPAIIGLVALIAASCDPTPTGTTTGPIDFESYNLGSIDGQQGWESDGAAPNAPLLDHAVDDDSALGTT